MGGLSIWHWLIVLLVVVLVFGTKKLRNVGSDLGSAIRSFRKSLNEDEPERLDAESHDGQESPANQDAATHKDP